MLHNEMQPWLSALQTGDAVALFLGLYLGHILGDFVFQPGRLVIAKREHQAAAVLHSVIVTVCTALVLAGTLSIAWPAVVIAGIAHLVVEQLSIGARRNPAATSLTIFLLDQGLHIVALAMIAMFSGTAVPVVIGTWPTTLARLAAIGAISTVAFGGSILVFEVQLALAHREDETKPVLGLDFSRLYGMAERGGALAGALVLPVPLLGALAFMPRVVYALASRNSSKSDQLAAAAVGIGLVAVGWALVASVVGLMH